MREIKKLIIHAQEVFMITQERLKELFYYNKTIGLFVRLKDVGKKVKRGDLAGTLKDGYIKMFIDGRSYYAHRLIWLYVKGELPKEQIDHINGNKSDNTFNNLRAVSHSENAKNQPIRGNNTSGFIGIYWSKQKSKWHSRIYIKGKCKNLGLFDNLSDAVLARINAEGINGYHINHGREKGVL